MTPEFRLRRDRESFVRPRMMPRFTVPATTEPAPVSSDMLARFAAPEVSPTFPGGAFGAPDSMPVFNPPPADGEGMTTPPSPYQQAVERYRTLRATAAKDENGPGRSGLGNALLQAGEVARRTGSLGQAAGAGIVGLISGLVNSKQDEERKKVGEEGKALEEVKNEAALEAERRKAAADLAGLDHTQAQTANERDLPVFRREKEAADRKADEARAEKMRADAERLAREAAERARHNQATEGQAKRETERKAEDAKAARELKLELQKNDSQLRRDLEATRVAVQRERIAAENSRAGAERGRKEAEFKMKRPGTGKELSAEDAITRGRALGLKPNDAIKRAAELGYDVKF